MINFPRNKVKKLHYVFPDPDGRSKESGWDDIRFSGGQCILEKDFSK